MKKNIINFDIECPECNSIIETEMSYNHIKQLLNYEKDVTISCKKCKEDINITIPEINDSIKNLPEKQKIELESYLDKNIKNRKFKLSPYTERFLIWLFVVILFFIIGYYFY